MSLLVQHMGCNLSTRPLPQSLSKQHILSEFWEYSHSTKTMKNTCLCCMSASIRSKASSQVLSKQACQPLVPYLRTAFRLCSTTKKNQKRLFFSALRKDNCFCCFSFLLFFSSSFSLGKKQYLKIMCIFAHEYHKKRL